jgi:hypothetical protein
MKTMELFQEGMFPDEFTLKCSMHVLFYKHLKRADHIHSQIIQSGCELDLCVGSTLIHM